LKVLKGQQTFLPETDAVAVCFLKVQKKSAEAECHHAVPEPQLAATVTHQFPVKKIT